MIFLICGQLMRHLLTKLFHLSSLLQMPNDRRIVDAEFFSSMGCRLWGRTESDTTEATQQQQQGALNLLTALLFFLCSVPLKFLSKHSTGQKITLLYSKNNTTL